MQKLVGKNTYTPTDPSQVRSNCELSLNRKKALSVSSLNPTGFLKTPSSNPEMNYPS